MASFVFYGSSNSVKQGVELFANMYSNYEGRQIEVSNLRFIVTLIDTEFVYLQPLFEHEYLIDNKRHYFNCELKIPLNSLKYYQK